MASDNVERYREALEAWNRRDLVWILEQASPDFEFHTAQLFPGIEPVYRGREGMVEFWTTFIEEPWALFRLDVDELMPAGDDRVLALITFTGTERGVEHRGRPSSTPTWRPSAATRSIRIDAFADWDEARAAAGLSRLSRVLQHVSIEIPPDQVERRGRVLGLLGFEPVESPEPLGGYVTWVERAGTQIHLIHTDGGQRPGARPRRGRRRRLRRRARARRGRGPRGRGGARSLWGARRAFAIAPGGHRVELMASPPPPARRAAEPAPTRRADHYDRPRAVPGRVVHPRRAAPCWSPISPTSTGPSSASSTCPETVKGAMFARYSRYPGTLRRMFLDEFAADVPAGERPFDGVEGERAAGLYERVFIGYGDDSIAQVGGAHVACEWVSNVLTKVLQRGRLAAYLEQSTRYIPYDQPIEGMRRLSLLLR